MVDFTNFARLDAYEVQKACVKFSEEQKVRRDEKFKQAIDKNRKNVGWPWSRRPETDDEVIERKRKEYYGYFGFFEYQYMTDAEYEVIKLIQLCNAAIKISEYPTVYINQQTAVLIEKYM